MARWRGSTVERLRCTLVSRTGVNKTVQKSIWFSQNSSGKLEVQACLVLLLSIESVAQLVERLRLDEVDRLVDGVRGAADRRAGRRDRSAVDAVAAVQAVRLAVGGGVQRALRGVRGGLQIAEAGAERALGEAGAERRAVAVQVQVQVLDLVEVGRRERLLLRPLQRLRRSVVAIF